MSAVGKGDTFSVSNMLAGFFSDGTSSNGQMRKTRSTNGHGSRTGVVQVEDPNSLYEVSPPKNVVTPTTYIIPLFTYHDESLIQYTG